MVLSNELEQLQRKRVELEEKLHSIGNEERTLIKRARAIEDRLVVQALEGRLHTFQFPVLRGDKALNVLYDFISELREQRTEEISEKQKGALIKLANGLIHSVKADMSMMKTHAE